MEKATLGFCIYKIWQIYVQHKPWNWEEWHLYDDASTNFFPSVHTLDIRTLNRSILSRFQDIIHMYKMQQQLGAFAKQKSREELEVPSYTTTVPSTVVANDAWWAHVF